VARDALQTAQVGKYFAECAAYPVPDKYKLADDLVVLDNCSELTFARLKGSFSLEQPLLRGAALNIVLAASMENGATPVTDNERGITAGVLDFTSRLLARNLVLVPLHSDTRHNLDKTGEKSEVLLAENAIESTSASSGIDATTSYQRFTARSASTVLVAPITDICELEKDCRRIIKSNEAVIGCVHSSQGSISLRIPVSARAACFKCAFIRLGVFRKNKTSTKLASSRSSGMLQADIPSTILKDSAYASDFSIARIHLAADSSAREYPVLRVPGCDACASKT
jgi:hypothetical protein